MFVKKMLALKQNEIPHDSGSYCFTIANYDMELKKYEILSQKIDSIQLLDNEVPFQLMFENDGEWVRFWSFYSTREIAWQIFGGDAKVVLV